MQEMFEDGKSKLYIRTSRHVGTCSFEKTTLSLVTEIHG